MRKISLLSLVIPCHNEEEGLIFCYQKLTRIMEVCLLAKKIGNYELVFVDNGSTDNTLQILKDIFEKDEHLKIISLRRNFGYQGSISAGLFAARGDAVVSIDADLQDPPEKIEEMLQFFQEGYDLVLGIRKDRSSDSFMKRFFSESYYRLMSFLGVDILHNHGDFRLMSRGLVNEFKKLTERNRFIRAMILQLESKYAVVSYTRVPRVKGKSKFNLPALFSLSIDGIVSFSYAPLRLSSLLGGVFFFFSLLGVCWVLTLKFGGVNVPGWASILLPILFLGGLQLFILGVIGEYIGRMYLEIKNRPLFLVREEFSHVGE